jgi:hypothetical protein
MSALYIALLITLPPLFLGMTAVALVISSTRITRKGDPS